ncbi:MAG TPA: hypothetical protein VGE86_01230, partial [Thermoanaerobaculia bacterium]
MKSTLLAFLCLLATSLLAGEGEPAKPAYAAELAQRLGADARGMRMYVLCILKTGPKDAEIKGDER